jgi:hypothetical protein
MLLMLDYGIFYEFIPNGSVSFFKSESGEPGGCRSRKKLCNGDYDECGLWRYLIGDTVVFTSINLSE